MGWYTRFVTTYPWLIIGADILFVIIITPVSIWYAGMPDLSDPNKGFEPRGTLIHGWNEATTRFTAELIGNGSLSYFPPIPEPEVDTNGSDIRKRRKRNAQECLSERLEDVAQRIVAAAVIKAELEDPPTAIPRMVAETKDGKSLWKAKHMRSICKLEKKYIKSSFNGCPAFSLPYYISALRDKDCKDINEGDMDAMEELLQMCRPYFLQGSLSDQCFDFDNNGTIDDSCFGVPYECTQYNAPYYIFQYLTDKHFLKNDDDFLKYSMIVYRKSWDYDEESLFEHYVDDLDGYRINIESGDVVVKAMDHYMIFNKVSRYYVLGDMIFYILAMILVVLVLLIYLRSFSLMLAVVMIVSLSLITAYFFYAVVFQFKYFSFINLLAALLLIAVGADDVFILHDIWYKCKIESKEELTIEAITGHTLHHGVLSILVTSMTTSCALFANGVSDVTALKCFGIFGGVCILVNFFFMITLVPAILVVSERFSRKHPDLCRYECCLRYIEKAGRFSDVLWGKIMPIVVLKPWLPWLLLFSALGVGGALVVFYKPALQLSESEYIQVFYDSHPWEVYRAKIEDKFHFEIDNKQASKVNIELLFIFGIKGEDNGNILDPDDRGKLQYDHKFEIRSGSSQRWMKKFCHKLLEDSYTVNPERYLCFFDIVESISDSGICEYPQYNLSIPAECCTGEFPKSKTDADICYKDHSFIQLIYGMATAQNMTLLGTPAYKAEHGKIKAMTYQIETDFIATTKQTKMDDYYTRYTKFMDKCLKSAPKSLKGGWFSGAYGNEFFFYDLLKTMVSGTISGISLSMGVGFLVMMATSGNIVITIYSMATIAFIIMATVAVMVLLGWELAVLESLVITLAVGLSIDFTIHLAVAYKISPQEGRLASSGDALATVGSAVTMAGLTTFLSGAAICLGRVMSYYRFGIFLMVDMSISWAFSMFFFIPLCRIIGPEGNVGEIKVLFQKCLACCRKSKTDESVSEDNTHKKGESIDTQSTSLPNGNTPNGSGGYAHQNGYRKTEKSLARKRNQSKEFQDFSDNKLFTIDDKEVARTYGYVPFRPSNKYLFQGNSAVFNPNKTSWTGATDANFVDHKHGSISVPTSPTRAVYLPANQNVAALSSPYMLPVQVNGHGYTTAPYMYAVQQDTNTRGSPYKESKISPYKGKSLKRQNKEGNPHPALQRSYTLPAYVPEAYFVMPTNGWANNVYYG